MDILPIENLTRIVEMPRHKDGELPERRPPQRKREKAGVSTPVAVYKPDGHVEEQGVSKIDIVGWKKERREF
jgi:hypothetical protein